VRVDVNDGGIRNARFQLAVENAAFIETQIVGENDGQ
jgi:hypothetical protein